MWVAMHHAGWTHGSHCAPHTGAAATAEVAAAVETAVADPAAAKPEPRTNPAVNRTKQVT